MFRNIRSSLFITPALLLATGCMLDLPDPNATQSYPCARRSDCLSGYECFNGFCEDRSNCVDRDGDGHSPPMDGCGGGGDCDDADAAVFNGSSPLDSETACMRDADGDDYGDEDVVLGGSVVAGTDCDDSNVAVFTGAAPLDSAGACMKDADGDDYGDGNVSSPVIGGTDCNDNDVNVFPGAAERESTSACKRDADGDGFGEINPGGNITAGTDCDDGDQFAFPGSAPNETAPALCYRDADDDNYGDDAFATNHAIGTDCLDSDAFAFPGAAPNNSPTACMRDADGDDYGDSSATPPVTAGSDCNDTEPEAWTSRPEVCYDLIDNNCDSQMDCGDGACTGFCNVAFVSLPDSPTGWTEVGGTPIEMTFSDLDPSAPSATVYQCRTGPIASIASKAWGPCDGATGATGVHHPTATVGNEDGTYRTEVRLRFSSEATSPVVGYDYYVHRSLNGATRCPQDVTDAAMFAAAAPSFVSTPVFDVVNMELENPFLTIKFANGTLTPLSLRHRFVLNAANTMLLMTRRFPSLRNPSNVGCRARLMEIHRSGTPDWHDDPALKPCDAVVFNQQSVAVCLLVTAGPVATATWVKKPASLQLDEKTFSPKTTTAPAPGGSLLLPP